MAYSSNGLETSHRLENSNDTTDAKFVEVLREVVGILVEGFVVDFSVTVSVPELIKFLALSRLLLGEEGMLAAPLSADSLFISCLV